MRWEDERYVRLYTRDTPDWLVLSFEAQGLLGLIIRKVDRAGILPLGRHGARAVAIALGHAHRWEAIAPALEELLADGCIQIQGNALVIPNFIEAQEAAQSDAMRKRESRAKARDVASASGRPVTKRDEKSQVVTDGHNSSQVVTPSRAVPSCAEPNQPGPDAPAVEPVSAFGGMPVGQVIKGAEPGRRAEDRPDPRPRESLQDLMLRAWKEETGQDFRWRTADDDAIREVLTCARDDWTLIERVWRVAATAKFPTVTTVATFAKDWNAHAANAARRPPKPEAAATSLKHLG